MQNSRWRRFSLLFCPASLPCAAPCTYIHLTAGEETRTSSLVAGRVSYDVRGQQRLGFLPPPRTRMRAQSRDGLCWESIKQSNHSINQSPFVYYAREEGGRSHDMALVSETWYKKRLNTLPGKLSNFWLIANKGEKATNLDLGGRHIFWQTIPI
ncbi:hypothetical protein M440DRAFT_1003917 [Trichoderma longibrachiatum ATCC 18648]|uniref:Uncharacterized protein n=1 Tax=Trichoderma longibrachiatum ATCC 18648 TaxID=983965 RepID=A0A2T4CHG3_TRILO|nr:hypothetical protein M440DRAFT_1003917 [Trichoderma longibrachiatum ATCC 18648]